MPRYTDPAMASRGKSEPAIREPLPNDVFQDPPTQLSINLLARRVINRMPGADLLAYPITEMVDLGYHQQPIGPKKRAMGPYSASAEALVSVGKKAQADNAP
jgi:hypothetical protein